MLQAATYNENDSRIEKISKDNKRNAKYHHAAYAYVIIGIAYLVVFYATMPPHDLSGIMEDFINENMPGLGRLLQGADYNLLVNSLAVGAGTLFLGLSYFIYKGFRVLTIALTVIYGIRFILATNAFFSEDIFVAIPYILPLITITFYMLARAAWDLKP